MTRERAQAIVRAAKRRQSELGGVGYAGPWEDQIRHVCTPDELRYLRSEAPGYCTESALSGLAWPEGEPRQA